MNELNNSASVISNQEKQSWKQKRKFEQKLIAYAVLVFELSFVGTCAYLIVRNFF